MIITARGVSRCPGRTHGTVEVAEKFSTTMYTQHNLPGMLPDDDESDDDDRVCVEWLKGAYNSEKELRGHASAHRTGQETIVLLEDENKLLRERIVLLEETARTSAVRNGHAANYLPLQIARAREGKLYWPSSEETRDPRQAQPRRVSPVVFAQAPL